MSILNHWEEKIKEKRKATPFREFVMEIASWSTLNLYRQNGRACRYPPTERSPTLGDKFWEEAPDFGRDYDSSKSFFKNFQELYKGLPIQYMLQIGNMNENCEFADAAFGTKNAYLSFVVGVQSQNIAYSAFCYDDVSDVYNSFLASQHVSNIFMSGGVTNSHNIYYSKYISDSSNIWFSTNLIGCQECIDCDRLENQKYHIGNTSYSQEDYLRKKNEYLKDKSSFLKKYIDLSKRPAENYGSENVTGGYIIKSSNVENGGWIVRIHDSRNFLVGNGSDGCRFFFDTVDAGMNSSHFYGVNGAGDVAENLYCSSQITHSSNLYYSYFMDYSSFCLGCIGLRNKSYCILNKQYEKEEWHEKVEQIFASMEQDGTLGRFFPASMNPFYFNDTLASLVYEDFTKEEAEAAGFMWRNEVIRTDTQNLQNIISSEELDKYQGYQNIDGDSSQKKWSINSEILTKTIQDKKGNLYKIIPMELAFLEKHELPLPEIHWLDRIKLSFRG